MYCFFLQNLDSSAKTFSLLLKEIQERSATFMPGLSDADAMALQQTTKSAEEKYERFEDNYLFVN